MKRLCHLLIIGIGLAFLDLVQKTGAPCVFGACSPNSRTSDTAFVAGSADHEEGRAPLLPAERVSATGVYYGQCVGTILAVFLFPEPCGWQERPINVASR
jgi:hypothetical protein